jgi:hypothetical protein
MQAAARYLVLIEQDGGMVARLFDERRHLVGEFDGSSEEVAVMTRGLQPQPDLGGPEWETPLQGHSLRERSSARLYVLDV